MLILVTGSGVIACSIAEELMDRHEVVLVGPDIQSASRIARLDVQLVTGLSSSVDVLHTAQIERCDVFIAASDNDETNLVACIAARRLGAKRTISILANPGFLEMNEQDRGLAESLGLDAVVRPSVQLALEILRIIRVSGALDVEDFHHGRVRLVRHIVEKGSAAENVPVRDLPLPSDVVLVMGRHGDEAFIPNGDTVFRAGDKLTAIGTKRSTRELVFDVLRAKSHGAEAHRATIVGGGDVGLRVALGLEHSGWEVKLIETNLARCNYIAEKIQGLVLHGDGSDMDLLEEEAIGRAPVLIAVTNNDEKNLLVSLLGRHLGVDRIITRADRLANEKMFEKVGIDVVRSARGAAIRRVIRELIEVDNEIIAELEHGEHEVVDLELPSQYPRVTINDLRSKLFTIVGAIFRANKVIIPTKDTVLLGGDHLLVFTSCEDASAAKELYLSPTVSNAQER
ncbi:MAG: Trk system potassium transporter TrkA [Myxococcota bacterium]|nr:Trk system potassium transporter TrkA [Myxococcota bacterium]